jgi:hypothetical protein
VIPLVPDPPFPPGSAGLQILFQSNCLGI